MRSLSEFSFGSSRLFERQVGNSTKFIAAIDKTITSIQLLDFSRVVSVNVLQNTKSILVAGLLMLGVSALHHSVEASQPTMNNAIELGTWQSEKHSKSFVAHADVAKDTGVQTSMNGGNGKENDADDEEGDGC